MADDPGPGLERSGVGAPDWHPETDQEMLDRLLKEKEKERLAQALREGDTATFTEAARKANHPRGTKVKQVGDVELVDGPPPAPPEVKAARTLQRDATRAAREAAAHKRRAGRQQRRSLRAKAKAGKGRRHSNRGAK